MPSQNHPRRTAKPSDVESEGSKNAGRGPFILEKATFIKRSGVSTVPDLGGSSRASPSGHPGRADSSGERDQCPSSQRCIGGAPYTARKHHRPARAPRGPRRNPGHSDVLAGFFSAQSHKSSLCSKLQARGYFKGPDCQQVHYRSGEDQVLILSCKWHCHSFSPGARTRLLDGRAVGCISPHE